MEHYQLTVEPRPIVPTPKRGAALLYVHMRCTAFGLRWNWCRVGQKKRQFLRKDGSVCADYSAAEYVSACIAACFQG